MLKQICKHGHNLLIAGRYPDGHCRECVKNQTRNRSTGKPIGRPKTQLCKRGHNTAIVGRSTQGICNDCNRLRHWKHIINADGSSFTIADRNIAYANQLGMCKMCHKHESTLTKILAVDHDHKTGMFRGLLCDKCNFRLGLHEDLEWNKKVDTYLHGQ